MLYFSKVLFILLTFDSMKKLISILLFLAFSHVCNAHWPTPSFPIWTGINAGHLSENSISKAIDANGAIFIATHEPNINGSDIWIQKMDSSGNLLWGFAGVQVLPSTNTQKNPVVLPDGSGGCFLAYFDDNAPFGAFVQHYDINGLPLLPGRGRKLVSHISNFWDDLSMVTDGQFLFCTMTLEKPATNEQVYAQKLDLNLNLLWDTTGIAVSPSANEYQNRSCLPDGQGGLTVLFTRYSSSINQYLRVQHLDGIGNLLWSANGIELNTGQPTGEGRSILEKGPQSSYYVCWDGGTNSLFTGIYLSKIDSAGVKSWGNTPVTVFDTINNQDLPDLEIDTNGNAYVTWRDFRSGVGFNCYVQKVSQTGNLLWTIPTAIDTLQQPQYVFPRILLLSNGLHVYWGSYTSNYILKKQVIDGNGNKRCTPSGFDLSSPGFTPVIDNYLIRMPQGGICFLLTNMSGSLNNVYIEYNHTACVLPVAVEEIPVKTSFALYPNPAEDFITLEQTNGWGSVRWVQLFDINGRLQIEKSVTPNMNSITFSIAALPAGVYILKAGNEVMKFVK